MNTPGNYDDAAMLSKDKIIELLHNLDDKLTRKVRLDIGGGAAAILKYGIERRTTDVDIIKSSIPMIQLQDMIEQTAREAHIPPNPHNELWLNDNTKRVKQYLDPDYESRLTKHPDTFKNLDISFISKADLVIMKLAIDNIRERDINDLISLNLTIQERNLIHRIIDSISKHDPDFARYMETKFNEFQPETRNKGRKIAEKKDIKTLEDLCEYAEKVWELKIKNEFIVMWRQDLLSGETNIETLVKTVDALAAQYRKNREKPIKKERDNGLDL